MPQRWICCRCDNGWTLQPGSENNICGNPHCNHAKCVHCEVRVYNRITTIDHAPSKEVFGHEPYTRIGTRLSPRHSSTLFSYDQLEIIGHTPSREFFGQDLCTGARTELSYCNPSTLLLMLNWNSNLSHYH